MRFNVRLKIRKAVLNTLIGYLVCTSVALGAAIAFNASPHRTFVPLAFIFVVSLTAAMWGTTGAVAGLLTALVVFVLFLFQPLGSWSVATAAARENLGWMVVFGVSGGFLFVAPPPGGNSAERKPRN